MDMQTSKTKLFLIELIIIILFFSIAGAVCVNLFAQAKLESTASTDITNAMLQAQAAAEIARDTNGDVHTVGFPEAVQGDNGYSVYYDAEWNPISGPEGAVYTMNVAFTDEGELTKADIGVEKTVVDKGQDVNKELYSINTVRFNRS